MEALRIEEVALQATAAKVESLAADQKEVMSETQAVPDGSVSIWSANRQTPRSKTQGQHCNQN